MSRYGVGDLGAIRLRLLHVVGYVPLADRPLRLVARTGTEWDMVSGVDGVVPP